MSATGRHRGFVAPSKPAAPSAAKSDAIVAPVEKEYIHNLQQQVYILECEAKYLRTKEHAAGPGPDAATLAANSFMGPPEDITANTNLGDMAKDLKSRCAEVEAKYQQQVRKANMAAAEYEQKKQYLKLNQQQLEQERDATLRQIDELFVFVTKQKDAISSQMYTLSDKERELNKQLQTLELELKEMIAAKHDALMQTSHVENVIRDCNIDTEQFQKETSSNQAATADFRSNLGVKKEQIQQMKKKLQELMGCMNGQEESEFTSAIQLADQEIQQLQMREQQIKAQIEGEERKHESYSKELAQAQLKKFEAQQVRTFTACQIRHVTSHLCNLQVLKREELRLVDAKNVSMVADLRGEKVALQQQFLDETASLDKAQARLSAAHSSKAKADADASQASSELHLLQRKIEDGNDQVLPLFCSRCHQFVFCSPFFFRTYSFRMTLYRLSAEIVKFA
jgi:DNA repair exonuclease SbcCD ATPase subunit